MIGNILRVFNFRRKDMGKIYYNASQLAKMFGIPYNRALGRINSPFAKERWGRVVTPYLYRCGVQIPTCYLSRGIQESKVSLKFRLGGTTSESCTRGVA